MKTLEEYEADVQKVFATQKDKFLEADTAFAKACQDAGIPVAISALALVGIHENVADRLMKMISEKAQIAVESDDAKDEEE